MGQGGAGRRRTFVYRHRLRWGDIDPQGVVFYARFLSFFDDAWTEMLRAAGLDYRRLREEGAFDVHVVHGEIDWRAPARHDEVLAIAAAVSRWSRASFDVRFRARVGRTTVCEAVLTYVSVDPATLAVRPVPEAVRRALEAMSAPTRSAP